MSLLKIITVLRIKREVSLIKRILNKKFNLTNFPYIYLLLKIFIEISLGITIYFFIEKFFSFTSTYLLYNRNSQNLINIMFFILVIHAIYNGLFSYSKTHIFPFEELRIISEYSERKAYIILTASELIYSISNSIAFPLAISIFLIKNQCNSNIFNKLILLSYIIVLYLCHYIISNRIMGIYIYNIIIKKIGFIRFITYCFSSISLLYVGGNFFKIILMPIIKIINKNFISKYAILEDQTWITFTEEVKFLIINSLKNFLYYIFSFINIISENYKIISVIILIISVSLIFIIPIKLINIYEQSDIYEKKDICSLYVSFLIRISSCFFKSKILVNNLKSIKKKKWLVSKGFFSTTILSYESFFFLGLFTSMIVNTTGNLRLQLLLVMNLMIMGNQSFEIRDNWYPLFSLGIEREKLDLILTAKNGFETIFKYKMILFILIFLKPIFLLIVFNILIGLYLKISIINILILLLFNVIGWITFPLIQMYMIPLVTKFDFVKESEIGESDDEQIVIERLQSIPRYILIIVPIFITLFIVLDNNLSTKILYFEYLYLVLSFLTIFFIVKKVLYKGLKKLYEGK